MEDNQKKASIWKGVYIKVFVEISTWIIGPVLIAALLGNYFDTKWGTTPWILGLALALSFTVSMIAIVKIAKKYEGGLDNKDKNGK